MSVSYNIWLIRELYKDILKPWDFSFSFSFYKVSFKGNDRLWSWYQTLIYEYKNKIFKIIFRIVKIVKVQWVE